MELLLQHMYLILHCSHLHLLQRTCDGGGWSKVKGCISCVVLPALVQANHLGLEVREVVKLQTEITVPAVSLYVNILMYSISNYAYYTILISDCVYMRNQA